MRAGRAQTNRAERLVLILLWFACSTYVWSTLDHGWIPHDEGTLAHAAQRVAAGELPHRDFDDVYTGGLAMANAVALSMRGDLMAPRILLFLVFVVWAPVFFWIARRFAPPGAAAATTVLAVMLGLPVYPAAMPSWYNLYFATFGLAAILAWMDGGRRRWLFVAGLMGGLSVLVKISGLYYVAAAATAVAVHFPPEDTPEPGRAFPLVASFGALALALAVVALVGGRFGTTGLIQFALPIALLLAAIVTAEWLPDRSGSVTRLSRAARHLGVLGLGFALPVVPFVLPYAISGSIGQLLNGLLVLPTRRFEYAIRAPWALSVAFFLPPLLTAFLVGQFAEKRIRPIVAGLASSILLILFWASGSPLGYLFSWFPLYYLVSIATLAGGTVLLLRNARGLVGALRSLVAEPGRGAVGPGTTVVLLTAGMAALIQVPYAGPIYALYVAPLGLLAALAVLAMVDRVAGPGLMTVSIYLILFLAVRVHPGNIWDLGRQPGARIYSESLDLARGGIRVTANEKAEYERAVALLQEHADGMYVLAAPDCPELYFLSGHSNPTRNLFEFFAHAPDEEARLLELIETRGVRVVAINNFPGFSGPFSAAMLEELARRFPEFEQAGRFTVRWSNEPG